MIKQALLSSLLLPCLALGAEASDSPLWMRHCAISPDASTIAFTYKGNIFTVPATGGEARQLTSSQGVDTQPVWSPDSKRIAFASNRQGSMDVYVVDKKGGSPVRLTTHSSDELPISFADSTHVLYEAWIMPSAQSIAFPSAQFKQVYKVSVDGGRPELYSAVPMQSISINSRGQILYQDCKGYEDPWRKHHTSPIARDVWFFDPQQSQYRKLTTFEGEDRNPVWAPGEQSYYYLSEEKGSFNVFQRGLNDASARQLTHFTQHPVRFLTAATDGTLCFGYDGELYTQRGGGEPQKVNVQIFADCTDRDRIVYHYSNQATEMAVSPSGKEVAFIVHGDVYVTSVDYATTKRITNTPEQERSVSFSPDGRSLVYASERQGLWQIYTTSIVRKDDKSFTYASELKEERLTQSDVTSFYPKYSPDGKWVAFLENRTAIRIINVKSKDVRTVMPEQFEYSYSDGDQYFEWSPDSKWILTNYIGVGGWNNKDVALVGIDGDSEIINLTQSGYSDVDGRWVLDGKAIIFTSDRAGYRSHGSWGAEYDVYIMFFDAEAYDKFKMSKEELEQWNDQNLTDKEKEKEAEKEKDEAKDDAKPKKVKALKLDLENCQYRVVRLTVNSSHLSDAMLSKKGDALYYLSSFEGRADLWKHDLKDGSTRILLKGVGGGSLVTDKNQDNLYLCSGGNLKKIDVANASVKDIAIDATFDYKPMAERQYIFDHAWKQVQDKFYVPDLQGTDWQAYRESYKRFLPYINNNYDFAEMMSELLGELNASHTGMRYYSRGATYATASLGCFFDDAYKGDGLKIQEIIARSPLAQKKTDVKAGCIIEKIDGEAIEAGQDYFPLLEGKAGRRVVLSIYNPRSGKRFEEVIKPISASALQGLLYHRWVENNRRMVDKLSNGRLGYVHIKAMDGESFHTLYKEVLGQNRQKEALIVDTRHNGGGWLHDDVVTLLSGKVYERFMPRGRYIGSDPFNKWCKPSCMLVCEDNYSNAHGTPWVYKTLGVGKLVGTPVAGTMTAVWWEYQIDRSLVFGIPQVGCMDNDDRYLENHTLQPDVLIYNTPEEVIGGDDQQIKAAVQTLLSE